MSLILQDVVLVFPKVSYWGGKSATKQGEFDTSNLPEIVNLGMKTIFDQKKINELSKYRKAVERLGLEYGSKFETGFMVPKVSKHDYLKEYQALETKFNDAKSSFMSNFDTSVEDYINQHPADETIIRSSLPDRSYVENSIMMRCRSYEVELTDGEISPEEVKSGIYHETALVCKGILEDAFFKRATPLKGKALKKRFAPTLTKLKSFAFVNSNIGVVNSKLDEYFAAINEDVLDENELNMGQTLFSLLSNAESIEQIVTQNWVPTITVAPVTSNIEVTTSSQGAYF